MKMLLTLILAAVLQAVPDLAFDSAQSVLTLPDGVYLGEVAGVAATAKGDIYVYTRTGHPTISLGTSRAFAHGGSQLFQFDRAGKFVREIGKDSYGMLFAQQVRVDAQDNVWIVDQMAGYVNKLGADGRPVLLLGRKPEAVNVPSPAARGGAPAAAGGEGGGRGRGGAPGAGAASDVFNRPTDVAWDAAGNIFVADGYGNARVAKFDSKGVFVKSWGSRGTEQGQFANVTALVVDAQGNVYAADGGNRRIQVFDNNGTFKTAITGVGAPGAMCITPGPNQVLFASDAYPGRVYKLSLEGKVLGWLGESGKQLKQFGWIHEIACPSENLLYVAELLNWRVQKLILK